MLDIFTIFYTTISTYKYTIYNTNIFLRKKIIFLTSDNAILLCIDSIRDDETISGFGEIWTIVDEDLLGGVICITC